MARISSATAAGFFPSHCLWELKHDSLDMPTADA